jgi:hypothetical protein
VIAVASIALAAVGVAAVSASAGEEPPNQKVTLCHRTNAENNPYVVITVDENAIANVILGQNGHATHTGPIFPDTAGSPPMWGDIIPAFNIPPNSFGGLNNTAQGLAILENGCKVPPPPTTAPPTTAPPRTAPPVTAPPVTTPPVTGAPSVSGAAGQAAAAVAVAGQPRTTG